MKNLLTRTLTGIVLAVVVLGGFLLHPVSFFLVQMLIMAGSMYEYYMIIKVSGKSKPYISGGLATGLSVYILSVIVASGTAPASLYLIFLPVIPLLMIAELYKRSENPMQSVAQTILPVLYIALPWSLFPFAAFGNGILPTIINSGISTFSPAPVIALILLLWSNDTGAYIFGVTLGRHRLFERISPKKTWEGFFGGLLLTLVSSYFLTGWFGINDSYSWIILAVLVSAGATFGDLVESMIKRSAGVKDSGSIMPGHGGFLDRFDSLLFAWPMVFIYVTFFG